MLCVDEGIRSSVLMNTFFYIFPWLVPMDLNWTVQGVEMFKAWRDQIYTVYVQCSIYLYIIYIVYLCHRGAFPAAFGKCTWPRPRLLMLPMLMVWWSCSAVLKMLGAGREGRLGGPFFWWGHIKSTKMTRWKPPYMVQEICFWIKISIKIAWHSLKKLGQYRDQTTSKRMTHASFPRINPWLNPAMCGVGGSSLVVAVLILIFFLHVGVLFWHVYT